MEPLQGLLVSDNSTTPSSSSSDEGHHGDGGQFLTGLFAGIIITAIIALIVRCCIRRRLKKKGYKLCKHGAKASYDVERPYMIQNPQYVVNYPPQQAYISQQPTVYPMVPLEPQVEKPHQENTQQ